MLDPRTQISNTYDGVGHSHVYCGMMNIANKDMRLAQDDDESCINWPKDQEVVLFMPNLHLEDRESDGSGFCSPPLWKNSPSPPRSPSKPLPSHHVYRSLSPNSRLQAIVRGQRELMAMVKNMPESSYELTLKDLVEHHKMETQVPPQVQRLDDSNKRNLHQRGVVKVKRGESKKNGKDMRRRESFENKGLYLKMVLPLTLLSMNLKNFASNISGKVCPKPEVLKGGRERDWWKKKLIGYSDSQSSRTINNNGSSGSSYNGCRKKDGFLTGCWPFLQARRTKTVE